MNPIKSALLLFVLTVPGLCVDAQIYQGDGVGASEDLAKQNALADLSSQLEIHVKSTVQASSRYQSGEGRAQAQESVNLEVASYTDLPLLGVRYAGAKIPRSGDYQAQATLDAVSSLKLYRDKLADLDREIREGKRLLDSASQNQAVEILLQELLAKTEAFAKYATVARLLGSADPGSPAISNVEVRSRLRLLEAELDSLDKAAAVLARSVNERGVFVFPPGARSSAEITPFAGQMRDALVRKLKSLDAPAQARYFFRGSYEILADGIEVSYRLVDTAGNVVKASVARLLPKAYEGLSYQPKSVGIDQLMSEGIVVSSDFRIDVTSNKGKQDLLFQDKEELEILVKLSASGYFYAVEHIQQATQAFSFLLELNADEPSKRRFVRYVGPDDVHKWVSLGKFQVSEPFGVERLQFIASNQDLIDKLPAHAYDEGSGYFVVSKDSAAAVVTTRGLKPKPGAALKSGEGLLTFTTLP